VSEWVLDASAVLVYLNQEPGWQAVEATLLAGESIISTVNYAEVVAKLAEKGVSEDDIRLVLGCLKLRIIDFTPALALASGLLRPATKTFGLSLGDRVCLALAQDLDCPVLTTDRAWESLTLGIKVVLIR